MVSFSLAAELLKDKVYQPQKAIHQARQAECFCIC